MPRTRHLLALACALTSALAAWTPAALAAPAEIAVDPPAREPVVGERYTLTVRGTVPDEVASARALLRVRPAAAGACAGEPESGATATLGLVPGPFSQARARTADAAGERTACAWLVDDADDRVLAAGSAAFRIVETSLALDPPAPVQQDWLTPGLQLDPWTTPDASVTARYAIPTRRGLLVFTLPPSSAPCPADGRRPPEAGRTATARPTASGTRSLRLAREPLAAGVHTVCGYLFSTQPQPVASAQTTLAVQAPAGPRPVAALRLAELRARRHGIVALLRSRRCHCTSVRLTARGPAGRRRSVRGQIRSAPAGEVRLRMRLGPGRWALRAVLRDRFGRVQARTPARRVTLRGRSRTLEG